MAFDFGIGQSILSAAALGDGTSMGVGLQEIADRYPAGGVATFLTNHDQPRAMTVLHGDQAAARQAAAALLTGPGVPFVYYGEELGMKGSKPDQEIRTPLPWTAGGPGFGFTTGTPWEPFAAGAETANVATEAADPTSLLSAYRDLIRLRAVEPELANGVVTRLETPHFDVAATLRTNGDRTAIVIQNLGDRPAEALALSLAAGPLCGFPAAAVAWASDGTSGPVEPPTVTAAGGLDGYVPLPVVAARSTVVLDLTP
jgi:glycosidase